MKDYIYLDNNSTTPLDPLVLDEMLPYFKEHFGNPASLNHRFGNNAAAAVSVAREKVASLIGADADEIIFTSGATESVNLALKGFAESNYRKDLNIVTTPVEHKSVLDTCSVLEKSGIEIRYAKVDKYGIADVNDIQNIIDGNTLLVTVMTANNEIGSIQPVAEIAEICINKKVVFHTDATQAVGKIPFNVNFIGADMISFSAHKIYGPKGIGALYIKKRNPALKISEQINGGGHEKGFRSGTLNVPAIVGFGKAAELCLSKMGEEYQKQIVMRDRFVQNILRRIPGTLLNGHPSKRLPNNINITFEGADAGVIISSMKSVACSTGSACSSATLQTSYVLKAIGRSEELSRCSLRFGIGRFTTEEEINTVIEKLIETVSNIRKNNN